MGGLLSPLHNAISLLCPQGCNGRAFLSKMRAHGFSSERVQSLPKRHGWIRPAPRASGLRRKLQCGVPSSNEERPK
jgi:hypothetical protein